MTSVISEAVVQRAVALCEMPHPRIIDVVGRLLDDYGKEAVDLLEQRGVTGMEIERLYYACDCDNDCMMKCLRNGKAREKLQGVRGSVYFTTPVTLAAMEQQGLLA